MFAKQVVAVNALRSLDSELGSMVTIVTTESTSPSFADLRLGEKVIGAITQKNSASLWPYKLVSWILERLLSRNTAECQSKEVTGISFNLQTTTPATQLQRLDTDTWIVHTPRGMLAAKQVLLATNAYTSHLLPEFSGLIVPVRGQMSSLIPPPAVRPEGGRPLVETNSYGFYGYGKGAGYQDDYLIQRPFSVRKDKTPTGGELMFGGGRDHAVGLGRGVSDDSDIDHQVASHLRMELNKVLDLDNNDKGLEASYEWSGVMGFSSDDRPWVGEVPLDLGGGRNMWICAGFTGHGMPNASLCAKAVVQMMMGKRANEVDLPAEYHCSSTRAHISRRASFAIDSQADVIP
jgi:glycine/D-amino acid oxidase-like deaminating enzyme